MSQHQAARACDIAALKHIKAATGYVDGLHGRAARVPSRTSRKHSR